MVAVYADPDVALAPPAWHARPAAEALRALHVNPRVGLTSQEAAQRRAEFGPNAPASAAREPRRWALARQFVEPMPLLLVTAGFGCFALGEPLAGVAALAVAALNAVLGLRSEGEPADIGGAVQRLFPVGARVLRDGVEQHVHTRDLVPGDIVRVEAGEEVPADGRLLDSVTLEADESALTGERLPAVKGIDLITDADAPLADRTDMLFTGTRVIRGAGEFVVTATGPATEAGRIAGLLAVPGEAVAPITSGPPWLTSRVLMLGFAALVVMIALGAVRGDDAESVGLAAVALTLGALPTALPAVVTVILAYAARALARAGAIVQRPPVLEALGSMSAINADASGLLTSDRLTAVELVLPARHYAIAATIKHVAGEPEVALEPSLLGFALSSDTAISDDGLAGDPVGGALVVLAEKGGLDVAVTRATYPRLAEVPYDAAHGLSATFHRMADASGADVVRCFVQGAPEALLARAVTELGPDLRPLRMNARARERYLADSARLAGRGLRVVACARRDFAHSGFEVPADALTLVDGLTLLSLVGIADPPRAGAKAAVASARAAGVRVRLVACQDVPRARALATAVGIEGRTVTGAELAALGERDLASALEQIGVVARATPEQRVLLVEALRRQGHVVAVAGGGLDHVPAMRAADIALATDAGRTDVSHAAAALTCTGDVAPWTLAVIAYGRVVHDDVVAYIRFQFGVLVGAILTFLGAGVLGLAGGIAFLPLQALYAAFTIQLAQGVGLGGGRHREEFAPGGPRIRTPPPPGNRQIGVAAAVQALLTLAVLALAEHNWGTSVARTMAFVTFGFATVVLSFRASAEWPPARSRRPLLVAAAVSIGAIVLAAEARPFRQAFDTEALSVGQWAICVGAALVLFTVTKWRRG